MLDAFVHLHVHTQYSLLDGAATIKKLIAKAKALDMPAIAITDHGSMYGVIDFYKEALKQGIKPIIGCEVYVAANSRFDKKPTDKEASYHLVLLCKNNIGYKNLMKLVSKANLEGFYYRPRVDKELLSEHSDGLIALSACLAGEIPTKILSNDIDGAKQAISQYVDIFGKDKFFLEVQNHFMPEDKIVNSKLVELAKEFDLQLVATNDLHYVEQNDSQAQDILMCIQTNKTVFDQDRMKFYNDEFFLKSYTQMQELFPDLPQAMENTLRIADMCNVNIELGQLLLPEFSVPEGYTPSSYLKELCQKGLEVKYPIDDVNAKKRLDFELQTIEKMNYVSYFLIVWDFVNFAKENNIATGPGRGSAAGSIVAYLLGITNIDPLKYDLLFERFLNPDRISMPDIDIDFCYERRQEVFDYVVKKYGTDKVAQIITFGTMAAKAAIRDVGRALNMPYGEVDKIAKQIPQEIGITLDKALESNKELHLLARQDEKVGRLIDLAKALEGMPRHSSVHAAGVVIAPEDISNFVPLQYSAEDFVTTQYDKDKIEEIGLLKMDLLGLRTLTVIADTIDLVKENRNITIDIDKIELQDVKTCKMLSRGQTQGIFQMESRGITELVKNLKPEGFEDLIPLVALYRPGPLGSGMADDFVNGRHGKGKVSYPHPLLEPVLKDTFGVILYQEQVMQITSVLAGFSLAQADILRRAMGKKKPEEIAAQKQSFIDGAMAKGIDKAKAKEIFELLEHFAGYGFNKSHSAAYALLAYQTAFLKAHYPTEFMAAMLTSVMHFNEKVSHYIEVCKQMGISVLPPDVNASGRKFTVDGRNIRFGLSAVKNVGDAAIEAIISARSKDGQFKSLVDFCQKTDMRAVNRRVLESLIYCGAFDFVGKRSQLLQVLDNAISIAAQRQKDDLSGQMGLFDVDVSIQSIVNDIELPDIEELAQELMLEKEKEIIGFYVTGNPLDKYRHILDEMSKIVDINVDNYQDGQTVTIGGIVSTCKRMSTRKGEQMASLYLEDFSSGIEVIVYPKVFEKSFSDIVVQNLLTVTGQLKIEDDKIKIMAYSIKQLKDVVLPIKLILKKQAFDQQVLVKIKQILQDFKGEVPVIISFEGLDDVIRLESDCWVDRDTESLIDKLNQVVGKDFFEVKN